MSQRTNVLAGIVLMMIALRSGSATVSAQDAFVPARYAGGALPVAPVLAVSGGEVFLQVLVTEDGAVGLIRTLRTTPLFTASLIDAVRGWRFEPAIQTIGPSTAQPKPMTKAVAAPVFVAAMFAPPVLNGPTLGEPPQDVAAGSDETPLPVVAVPAGYPPRATGTGTVLVEVTIDRTGVLTDAQIRRSSPGFDAAAIAAARSWSFRAGRINGNPVTMYAYLVFSFRPPVVAPGAGR
jgi:TonB family protein